MNVYNILWADDEIDTLAEILDFEGLKDEGLNILEPYPHNGVELEEMLKKHEVDAVIVDANFNETSSEVGNERDTSGLDYARGLYLHTLKQEVPFFMFTARTPEMLRERYKDNPAFLNDFPLGKRWFQKALPGDFENMIEEIKIAVDERKTTSFIVRNRYREELNAASLFSKSYDFVFSLLIREYENTLADLNEPFVSIRKCIERIVDACMDFKIIPPIRNDLNGTGDYFYYKKYSPIDKKTNKRKDKFRMNKDYSNIMPMPIAQGLQYVLEITQDGSHDKDKCKLKVDDYFYNTKDTLLLRSVFYMLLDCLKWFAVTFAQHQDPDVNEALLWEEVR